MGIRLIKYFLVTLLIVINNQLNAQGWEVINLSKPTKYHLNDVMFVNASVGYAVGDYASIVKTVDGGLNWVNQVSPNNVNLTSVFFTSNNIGYIAGDSGVICKTTDGGANWKNIKPSWLPSHRLYSNMLYSIFFCNDTLGYVVGRYDNILKTIDGGINWTNLCFDTAQWYSSVFRASVLRRPRTIYPFHSASVHPRKTAIIPLC